MRENEVCINEAGMRPARAASRPTLRGYICISASERERGVGLPPFMRAGFAP